MKMPAVARKAKTFFLMKSDLKMLLMEALCFLGFARLALLIFDFKMIAPHLGERTEDTPPAREEKCRRREAGKVGWAVATMSRYAPWESKCLAQALAAKIMLNRRKIRNTLYLGVAKDEMGHMIAHAWIKCGSIPLTGAMSAEKFTVVSAFSS